MMTQPQAETRLLLLLLLLLLPFNARCAAHGLLALLVELDLCS